MLKPSTLKLNIQRMAPSYRAFFERLTEWVDTLPEESYAREELALLLDGLARRKDFSRADWETLTKIQTKLNWAKKDPPAKAVSPLLDPVILEMSRR